MEKGVEINRIAFNLPESRKNSLFSLALFLERQEQLEHRAKTGQLLRSDLELLAQIETILIELQKIANSIKELNNK